MQAFNIIPLAVFLLCTIRGSDSYKILLGVPMASKSLHNLFSSLAECLAKADHQVTLITIFNASKFHSNIQTVNALGEKPIPVDNIFEAKGMYNAFQLFSRNSLYIGGTMWNNSKVVDLWKKRNSYDAVIIPSYLNEIIMPFLVNYTGLFMVMSTPGVEYFAISAASNWLPPSVVPAILLPYDDNMNFFERCINFVALLVIRAYTPMTYIAKEQELLEKFFPDIGDLMSYYDRVSLTLINGHPALDSPVPLLPNQVEIGTINAHPPRPLPEELERFMASSGEAGVIYFSIGSIALSTDIPSRAKTEFLKAFSRLPQKVLWKYEGDDLDLPPNVITRSWLPQQDVLGHPKTRLFISHCGNLGTQEAKYHGVPVLAVPVAFDQPRNAARMVRKGLALSLDWDTLTADEVVKAINTLLGDPGYHERVAAVSRVLHDQKESPGERAVWWVEHVIRHRGASYLDYAGKRLHVLQYASVDVVVFLAAVCSVCCWGVWLVCLWLCRRSRGAIIKSQKKSKLL